MNAEPESSPSDQHVGRSSCAKAPAPRPSHWDLISQNKRRSVILVLVLAIILYGISVLAFHVAPWVAPWLFPPEQYGPLWLRLLIAGVLAGGVIALAALWSYQKGADALLSVAGARQADQIRDRQLLNVVEEMSIAAGLPRPKTYVIESSIMNAFAVGKDPEHASIAITAGLRDRLSRDEVRYLQQSWRLGM